jgi:hypothetical protein
MGARCGGALLGSLGGHHGWHDLFALEDLKMTKLTTAQRARLEKLAAYLEGLPKRYRHFQMADYAGLDADDPKLIEYALRNGGVSSCGTVACAVGHGPAAGVLFPRRMTRDRWGCPSVQWDAYSELFVGESKPLYRWCFGGEWAATDNSHFGAAARIRYILANGAPPAEFDWSVYSGSPPLSIRKLYAPYRIRRPSNA